MPSDYQIDTCSSADRNKTLICAALPSPSLFHYTNRPPSPLSVQLSTWLLLPVAEENSLSALHKFSLGQIYTLVLEEDGPGDHYLYCFLLIALFFSL